MLSLQSFRGHSPRGSRDKEPGHAFDGPQGTAGDSRLRINTLVPQNENGEWHRLEDLESQGKNLSVTRTSGSTTYDEERARVT